MSGYKDYSETDLLQRKTTHESQIPILRKRKQEAIKDRGTQAEEDVDHMLQDVFNQIRWIDEELARRVSPHD